MSPIPKVLIDKQLIETLLLGSVNSVKHFQAKYLVIAMQH